MSRRIATHTAVFVRAPSGLAWGYREVNTYLPHTIYLFAVGSSSGTQIHILEYKYIFLEHLECIR